MKHLDEFRRDNDLASVTDVLSSAGIHDGNSPIDVQMLTAGRSNLTYRLQTSEGSFVLRRPPATTALPTAHNVRREFEILRALEGTDVPVPRTVLFSDEPEVNDGVPFYVMSFVDGIVPDRRSIAAMDPQQRRELALGLVRVLAAVHSVDVGARPALQALHRGDGYLARQVSRWHRQWRAAVHRSDENGEWVADWLSSNVPDDDVRAALVHGDFRLDNCIVDARDPTQVIAVVDWEMGTVGDPFLDLATFLSYWVRPADPPEIAEMFPTANLSLEHGFPERGELVEAYESAAGSRWIDRRFGVVLSLFKLAAICEGIHARYVSGGTRGSGFHGYDDRARTLLDYARRSALGEYAFA